MTHAEGWQIKKWLPIAGLILCLSFASNAAVVDIQSILKNLEDFDGKSVTIRGTAAEVNKRSRAAAIPTPLFKLKTRALRLRSSLLATLA